VVQSWCSLRLGVKGVLVKVNTIENIEQQIKQDIPTLIDWLPTNRLSLNLTKTHFMIFGSNKNKYPHPIKVEIEGTNIEEVIETKFLGVILQNGLGWKSHISYLSKKIAKTIGILAKAREILNTKSLTQLYYSFMYPYIVYCNIIWGNAPNSHLWQIFKLQKKGH
jgi:hypothetical protein